MNYYDGKVRKEGKKELKKKASVGIEPSTSRLRGEYSTAALPELAKKKLTYIFSQYLARISAFVARIFYHKFFLPPYATAVFKPTVELHQTGNFEGRSTD